MKLVLFCTFALVLVIQFNQSESCKCVSLPPQGHYCQSAFGARVLVTGKQTPQPGQLVYSVNVEQIYRANDAARKALENGKLYTNPSSASCGVDDMAVDRSYIITGNMANGKTSIYGCNFHVAYNDASEDIKRGFAGEYNCNSM